MHTNMSSRIPAPCKIQRFSFALTRPLLTCNNFSIVLLEVTNSCSILNFSQPGVCSFKLHRKFSSGGPNFLKFLSEVSKNMRAFMFRTWDLNRTSLYVRIEGIYFRILRFSIIPVILPQTYFAGSNGDQCLLLYLTNPGAQVYSL